VTDAALFNVILNNLLENAIKYSPPADKIYVDAVTSDNASKLCLVVKNRVGKAGVPDKAQVFKKYYRSELAHATTGSGLGLYIVQSLILLLGGKVEYRHEGDLVSFYVWFPI